MRNRLPVIATILAWLSLLGTSGYLLDKAWSIRAERDLVIQQASGSNGRYLHHQNVAFIGDSIIANFPLKAMLPTGISITNGGVIGYTMKQISEKYRTMGQTHHDTLFVEGGINDIVACVAQKRDKEETVRKIVESYDRICKEARNTNGSVIVCSILPVTNKFIFNGGHAIVLPSEIPVNEANGLVRTVNERLQKISVANQVQYCDLYSAVVDKEGRIQRGFVYTDGCHLNAFGYKVVADTIAKFL